MTYRTANLQSCILCIYSTNIGTEYFKHGIYSPFFLLQNAVCLLILTNLVPVLSTFSYTGCAKIKNNNSGCKRLWNQELQTDTTDPNNKPDIIIGDNEKGTCVLIDVTISGDRNVIKRRSREDSKI